MAEQGDRRGRWASLLLLAGVSVSACGNDDGGPRPASLMLPPTCPEATWSALHREVFGTTLCTGCHSGANADGAFDLSGTARAAREEVLAPTISGVGRRSFPQRVVPGDPSSSFLLERVTNAAAPGGLMPPRGPMIPQCQSEALRDWIEAGAPDN